MMPEKGQTLKLHHFLFFLVYTEVPLVQVQLIYDYHHYPLSCCRASYTPTHSHEG